MTNKMLTMLATGLVAGTVLASYKVQRDLPVSLDLTDAAGATFDFKCDDASRITRVVFYYRSGRGWYGNYAFTPEKSGAWEQMRIPKLARTELTPAGWGKIDGVRIVAMFRSERDRRALREDRGEPGAHVPRHGVRRAL